MGFMMANKTRRFDDLVKTINECTLCDELCHRTKVFSEQNGSIESKVLFVAEAPGRLGADRTGIPLFGDRTGENFATLLSNISWQRKDLFITNALLCNPRKANGNNGTPTKEQLKNCFSYLEMTLNLIQPAIVVSMGAIALNALGMIMPHSLELRRDVGRLVDWRDTKLMPLYHPGPRAAVHRAIAKQRSDFMALAKIVTPDRGLIQKRNTIKRLPAGYVLGRPFDQVISAVVNSLGKISYFKLTKLLYLIDLKAIERLGRTITGEIYIRQPDGPWPPTLKHARVALNNHEIDSQFVQRMAFVSPGPAPRFDLSLSTEELEVVAEVIEKFGHLTNSMIKVVAYRTEPMRYVLAEEAKGRDMRGTPIIYQDQAPRTIK